VNEAKQRSILVFGQRQSSFQPYNAPGSIGSAGRVLVGSVLINATAGQQRTITGILVDGAEVAFWEFKAVVIGVVGGSINGP
jgi:hypothetical protein